MSENKKDPLIPLTPEQQRDLEESAKFATLSGSLMDQITDKLMSLESEDFDARLFLLYQNIFRDAQANPQLLDYVAALPPNEMKKFKKTTLAFHYFHSLFITLSIGKNEEIPKPTADGLNDLANLFIGYNSTVSDSPYRMPALSHSKKDLWSKIAERLKFGREKRERSKK